MTIQQHDLKYCTQDPRCQGPRLIANHATECPHGAGEDCDNDQCWIGCVFCGTEAADAAASRN